jgi:hypothetical protein
MKMAQSEAACSALPSLHRVLGENDGEAEAKTYGLIACLAFATISFGAA